VFEGWYQPEYDDSRIQIHCCSDKPQVALEEVRFL
jgi:hypothetical protein